MPRRLLVDAAPLRQSPAFRRYWIGSGLSAVGTQMTLFAVTYQVFTLTNSSLAVGGIGLCAAVPAIAFGMLAGSIGDAADRRKIVLCSSLGLAAVSALFAVQVALYRLIESLGLLNLWTFKQRNALDLDEAEIPQQIDLLFIDTFHLYSQTLAELRKFVKHLRTGSWIVLHHAVSFPGVSKALLEMIQSFALELRFYPFIHQSGLSVARIRTNG